MDHFLDCSNLFCSNVQFEDAGTLQNMPESVQEVESHHPLVKLKILNESKCLVEIVTIALK